MGNRFWTKLAWFWLFAPIAIIVFIWFFQWIGQKSDSNQAAWVQAVGSILAIMAAFLIPYVQKSIERNEKETENRKRVMSAAANLSVALNYARTILYLAPSGDGAIGHDIVRMDQAVNFMKLQPEAKEALYIAIDKAHYFDEKLCERIVMLNIEAASYDRRVDELALPTISGNDPDEFFRLMVYPRSNLLNQIEDVRRLLNAYLPKE